MTSETAEKQQLLGKRRLQEWTTHVLLVALILIYSLIGAAIFQSVEEKHEQKVKLDLIKAKHEIINQAALGISEKVDMKNWTRMVDRLLGYYVEDLAMAAGHGIDIADVNQHEAESDTKWNFWGSLFYAGTVYTTIGYGNIAPATTSGKVLTVIYGMIGIPLCLILLADLGKVITKTIRHSVKYLKKKYYKCSKHERRASWPPHYEIDTMSGRSSMVILLGIGVVYIFGGALMYKIWEDEWSYLDAVYFIFVTTSTIGFGDVLPNHPVKFMITSLYIFLGLSLISTGFTIIQETLENRIAEQKMLFDKKLGISFETATGDLHKSVEVENDDVNLIRTSQTDAAKTENIETLENNNTLSAQRDTEEDKGVAVEQLKESEQPIQQETITASYAAPVASEKKQPTQSDRKADYYISDTRVLEEDNRNITVEATIYLD